MATMSRRKTNAHNPTLTLLVVNLAHVVLSPRRCVGEGYYPYHPGIGGVTIETMHFWFAPKPCPGARFISIWYPKLFHEVKVKLKAWQGGIASEPAPAPEPVWSTRFGLSLEENRTFFGTITRYNPAGTTDELSFDPKGAALAPMAEPLRS